MFRLGDHQKRSAVGNLAGSNPAAFNMISPINYIFALLHPGRLVGENFFGVDRYFFLAFVVRHVQDVRELKFWVRLLFFWGCCWYVHKIGCKLDRRAWVWNFELGGTTSVKQAKRLEYSRFSFDPTIWHDFLFEAHFLQLTNLSHFQVSCSSSHQISLNIESLCSSPTHKHHKPSQLFNFPNYVITPPA